ncbi:hypothetical protein CRG98_031063 [Punica granatum]|uniref:C2 NT-type domain-containing protein n=1 Tax=Punica granatum TaxID=22663 RepID=A0A2I0IWZ8_PUNGR|nr:hypothetical protein CRG98_031063 [Punica granatum]
MFKLNRNRAAKSGERVDFKFYQLKALQVPKGWDKLFVSIISVETGKTITKSSKASVRNGTCQWTENIAESIWVPQEDSSKELEDCLYKLVVAMGSARSGILGEATINITSYVKSSATSTVSIPLKKCNHGTVLQVKIHCLTPQTKLRDDESKGTNSSIEDSNPNSLEEDIKSDEGPGSKSPGGGTDSYMSKELGSSSRPEELRSQETTLSSFDSRRSSEWPEIYSPLRKKFPRENNVGGGANNFNGREDSTHSYGVEDASQSNSLYGNAQTIDSGKFGPSSLRIPSSSKDLLEAAENTIEALRSEAKMWERNSQKLMLDVDILRKEFSDQSKKRVSLEIELSEANADRDGLRKEVERMKLLVEKHAVEESQGNQNEGATPIQKELEEEIRFQKETNSILALQLSRSQESNIELVSVLQEMEETLEKQKVELEDLKLELSKYNDMEQSLLHKLADEKAKVAREIKEEYGQKLLAQEEEVRSLRAKITELTDQRQREESSERGNKECLVKEIELLKEKLQELERDCNELTEENLDLLYKLKEMNNGSVQGTVQSYELMSCEYSTKSVSSSDHEIQVVKESYDSYDESIRELEGLKLDLESKNRELGKELIEQKAEREKLEERLRAREAEIEDLKAMVSDLENERARLEEDLQTMQRESDVTFKCLSDLQNDLNVLSSSFDSHVSANRILETKSSELESRKRELEVHLVELERNNKELMASMSGFETELRSTRRERDALVEEVGSLRKLTEEFKKQNLELHEVHLRLESNLEELRDGFAAKAKVLEDNLSFIMEDVSLEEEKLLSRLVALLNEDRKREEELVQAEQVFNQFYVDKSIEIENLQKEVKELREKILEVQNERDKLVSQAADEISKVSADKAELEISFQEIQSLIAAKENEFDTMRSESENKVKGLMEDVAALRQDREKLSKLLESRRLGEEKLRTMINELELRLTVSEYERQQMTGKTADLKVQLQEIVQLKNELGEAKSDKEKLEADFNLIVGELEELKRERNAGLEKISNLEELVRVLEDYKHVKTSLEEKLVRLESELAANEAVLAEAMEVRSELSRVRKESRQFQQTMKKLEEERDEYSVKSRALEEALKAVKEEKKNQKYSSGLRNTSASKVINRISPMSEATNHSKNETSRSASKQRDARRKPLPKGSQVLEVARDQQSPSNASYASDQSFLTEIAETDNTCEAPHSGLFSDAVDSARKSTPEGEVVTKEKFERTKSSLESELIELRERYSQMSLRYAEVEAQREELVMKLKAARSAKRWFS